MPFVHTIDAALRRSIENCLNCHQICLETVDYSLQRSGRVDAERIKRLEDCAQACELAADFMSRGSPFRERAADLCAEICESCAMLCASAAADGQYRACADACREAASACRRMAEIPETGQA